MTEQNKLIEIFDKPHSGFAAFEALKPQIRRDLEMLTSVLKTVTTNRVIELEEDDTSFKLSRKPTGLKRLASDAQYIKISFSDVFKGNKIVPDQICSSLWAQGDSIIQSGINDSVANYGGFRLKFFEELANSAFFKNPEERQAFKECMQHVLTAEIDTKIKNLTID